MTTVYHQNVNTIVPAQATYPFPSQATQMHKQTIKITPQGTQDYDPGKIARFVLPSDGYLNAKNSAFTLNLQFPNNTQQHILKMTVSSSGTVFTLATHANGAAVSATDDAYTSLYLRIVDGPSHIGAKCVVADYVGATKVATMTNWSGPIADGVYSVWLSTQDIRLQKAGVHELIKRVRFIYGGLLLEDVQNYNKIARMLVNSGVSGGYAGSSGSILEGMSASYLREPSWLATSYGGINCPVPDELLSSAVPTDNLTDLQRSFTFNLLACGLANIDKLLPLKWMAAQFVIEIEFATAAEALISPDSTATFKVKDLAYIAEIMEFDSVYDTLFYRGMVESGVPIKFTSWHHQISSCTGTAHYMIHENARSIKAGFAMITDVNTDLSKDSNFFYHDAGKYVASDGSYSDSETARVNTYQWRIGGKYSPAQPVDCTKGASEAYLEYMKALNTLGDYTFDCSISPFDWSSSYTWNTENGNKFTMAQEFENTDVFPNTISGINAENQSDLSLKIEFSTSPTSGTKLVESYISFDNLLIVREGHLVDLVM